MTSIGTEAVNAYLVKNSNGEGEGVWEGGWKLGLCGVVWVYKIGLK